MPGQPGGSLVGRTICAGGRPGPGGDTQTDLSPGVVGGREFGCRLPCEWYRIGSEEKTYGGVVAAREVPHHLGDPTWGRRFVTRAGAHQRGERSDRRLVGRAGLRDRHRRAGPVGTHSTWLEDGDLHPERSEFVSEAAGETRHGPFGRLVGGQARAGHADTEGGDLEDVTAALLAQNRYDRLRHVHHTVEIGVDLCPERVDRRVVERGQIAVAGVVDDDIDATERLLGLNDRPRGRVVVGDVESQDEYCVAVLVDEILQVFRTTRRRHHPITRFQRDLDERATKPTRGPCHEPHLGH
ncbi:MAG: hypothetical protein QOH03_1534 [Kribbellaceae bacterium]|nr:hypothetical protein [Kribbellaceae bacterium]